MAKREWSRIRTGKMNFLKSMVGKIRINRVKNIEIRRATKSKNYKMKKKK